MFGELYGFTQSIAAPGMGHGVHLMTESDSDAWAVALAAGPLARAARRGRGSLASHRERNRTHLRPLSHATRSTVDRPTWRSRSRVPRWLGCDPCAARDLSVSVSRGPRRTEKAHCVYEQS